MAELQERNACEDLTSRKRRVDVATVVKTTLASRRYRYDLGSGASECSFLIASSKLGSCSWLSDVH